MKHIILGILAAGLLVGCDKKDDSATGAIDANKNATKDSLNAQKDAVDQSAKDAKATVEANKDAAKAQLDADKKKADAAAEAAKAQLPVTNK
jgi:hypothetical protein